MLRFLSIAISGALLIGGGSEVAAQVRIDSLYGIDFTQPKPDEKLEIDTSRIDGATYILHQIDPGLGGDSYLVETEAGEICEFVTVFRLEDTITTQAAFALLEEMLEASEDLYGPPSEASGPEGADPSQYTWLSGHDGERLPEGVAMMDLALGWSEGVPVAVLLKANHHQCEGVSAMGLP